MLYFFIKRLIIICLTTALPTIAWAADSLIDAPSTKKIMHYILRDHATFEKVTPELTRRTVQAFLEEMDPHKTYLIKSSIEPYLTPSPEKLAQISKRIDNQDFSDFYHLLSKMQTSIEKMNQLDKKTYTSEGEELECFSALKTLEWGDNYQQLAQREAKIRALQIKSAEAFEIDTAERMSQRLDKRQRSMESKITTQSKKAFHAKAHELFLKSFAKSLDDHSSYFTAWEAEQYALQVQQHLFGIGAQLRDDLQGFTLVHVLENSPVQKHGEIKAGDMIIAVDHTPVVGMDIEEAVQLIRGPKGSHVHLTLLRNSPEGQKKLEADIIRDLINLKETRFHHSLIPFGNGNIAYLRLFSFYQDSESSSELDIQAALKAALKETNPLKGVLLDLRSNGGGLLEQSVKVAGLFLKKGIVASIKDSQNRLEHRRTFRAHPIWDGPLVILTDRASASAAEIVAGSLKDYGRAIIAGDEHTWGKGSYQVFTFNPMQSSKANPLGEYKVTRGLYYTVSGNSPQLLGIKSDIEIPSGLKATDLGESLVKHPIENQTIEPNFVDNLEDVHPFYRATMKRQYKHNRQHKLTVYDNLIPVLKSNSKKRIESNPDFQNFLSVIYKENLTKKDLQSYGLNDLAKEECIDILKDLILLEVEQKKAA
ncbi:tail-specific protease [Candidatus Aerophobetes bacterium]|uniref:Tail-specific protease n=1 Tax=Aerophobetes bacterium TaxID=2030807 RepID=A0A2A4X1N0_UNCAE|nr:MAG: tail-specific protease [Candidatus Aerophobetes bacterium]